MKGKQNRAGLRQAWIGLAGILLLMVFPPMWRNKQMLTTFLSLTLAPPLIAIILIWLEGRIGFLKSAFSICLLASLSWIALGAMSLTVGPPWLDVFWLPQGIAGLLIAVVLVVVWKREHPYWALFAFLGLRAVFTSGIVPLISAVLSAAALLYLAYTSPSRGGFRGFRLAAPIAFGIAILLLIPFPFEQKADSKPAALKVSEGYKIKSIQGYFERVRSGDESNLKPLLYALHDADGSVRSEAVRNLGAIVRAWEESQKDYPDVVLDSLISRLNDAETRSDAIAQLAAIGDHRALRPLVNALRLYPDMDGYPGKVLLDSFGGAAAQLLLELLKDSGGAEWEKIRIRRRVLVVLGNYPDPRVARAIADHLGDKSQDVRQAAADSLMRMSRPDAVKILIPDLKDNNRHVRRSAADILRRIQAEGELNTAMINALSEALKDGDLYVRKYAAEALGNTRDKRALLPLLEALKDEDQSVRKQAVRALGNIGGESVVDPLTAALEDEYVRRDAAEALKKVGIPRGMDAALKAMIADLGHDNLNIRASAADVLGRMGSEEAVKSLITALRDPEWRVREMSATALGNVGGNSAINCLREALADQEPSVRRAAAEGLHKTGDPAGITLGVEVMLKDLDNRNPDTRTSAAEVLGRMGDTGVAPRLNQLAKADADPRVRRAAESALALLTNIQIRYWLMIGPFDNSAGAGFGKQYPPEQEVNLAGLYDGKGKQVSWMNYTRGETSNLLPFFAPNQHVVMYALTCIVSPDDGEAVFRVRSDDGIKVWLNDSLVWSNDVYRGMNVDPDVFPVKLRKGKNKVLVKVTQGDRDWGFYFRVTDSGGNPFHDLGYLIPEG